MIKSAIEQLGEVTRWQWLLVVLSIAAAMTSIAYQFVIRDKIQECSVLQAQTITLEKNYAELKKVLVLNRVHVAAVKHVTALKLFSDISRCGVSDLALNKLEKLSRDNIELSQFSISGAAQFASVLAALFKLDNVGVKSFELVADAEKLPWLSLKLEVLGFCDDH